MKRSLIIPLALLAFILFSAKRCAEDTPESRYREEQELTLEMDSLKERLITEIPGESALDAYQESAMQKLMDYSDYMAIARDTAMDEAFRRQAQEMAERLLCGTLPDQGEQPASFPAIDSTWLAEPLRRTGEDLYQGLLGFSFQAVQSSGSDPGVVPGKTGTVEIWLTRSDKLIATDTLRIWQLCLGEIR